MIWANVAQATGGTEDLSFLSIEDAVHPFAHLYVPLHQDTPMIVLIVHLIAL